MEFLHRCKVEDSEVMLCSRCNAVFDKKATKKVESARQAKKKVNWRKNRPQFYFDKRRSLKRRNSSLLNKSVSLVLMCWKRITVWESEVE